MAKKESMRYTLYGELDGMTIGRLREILDAYPDDAVIDVRSESVDWSPRDEDFFVIVREE
jgi:hypothetical protein